MFGCIGRIGCGLLLIVLGAVGWATRGVWLPTVRAAITADAPAKTQPWAPITAAGAARAKQRIASLDRPTGPAFVNVDAADFVAYVLGAALGNVTAVDSAPEAIIEEGTLYVRTRIRLSELGGKESLGPLARMFNDTESLLIAGRLEPVREGLAQFRLTEVGIRDLKVPTAAVAKLAARWGTRPRPAGVAATALPLPLPPHVADLRIASGKITLYKSTQ